MTASKEQLGETLEHTDQSVIVCRCEDISLEALLRSLNTHASSLEELKRYSRITMGPCQGRVCRPLLMRLWQGIDSKSVTQEVNAGSKGVASLPLVDGSSVPGFRPPVRAVSLKDIAQLQLKEEPEHPTHQPDFQET